MNFVKKISALWGKLCCFVLGHTKSVICQRCGRLVDDENNYSIFTRWKWSLWKSKKEYKGSIRFKPGLIKYSINLKTNELRRLHIEKEVVENEQGEMVAKHNAAYDPMCVYIDAVNDKNAIRKANNYIFNIKSGVRITEVTK